ncbi:DUF924 family protein [Ramlibacter alkalitolerans]|uniref:DUF924 family protein n=1 Tax=Ramlibacter alkalitolerans TaxID=2039631 RepID=A0ABS1JLA6_9BURK|nr:DUF924 family protein [Ramlibacter alkalitolerans]MBL0425024.1 DUF924 family protein [Ramlibacter alkalitolerans]
MSETEPADPPQEVLRFWQEAGPGRWFKRDAGFDAQFRARFLASHEAAASGALDHWLASAEGALALVLLLDQFPRNAFRGTPRMYATDAKARAAADLAIRAGFDRMVPEDLRPFFYLPFMHSEQPEDLERCVHLNEPVGGESLRFARHHRDIVARFGRFPHRNAVLGRPSTPDEERFLAEGGFGG